MILNEQSRPVGTPVNSLFRLSYSSLLSNPKNDKNLNKQLPTQITSLTKSNNNSIYNSIRINKIFQELDISDKIIKQICTEVNISKIREACKINYKENEILLIVEGEMYEYNCMQTDEGKNDGNKNEYILIRKLHKNQYFHNFIGEIKFQYQFKSRIIAQRNTVYIRIHEKTFRKYFLKKLEISLSDRLNLIKKSQILRDLRKFLLLNIANHLESQILTINKIIYSAGDKSDYLYFVKKGKVLMSTDTIMENQKFIVQQQNIFGLDGIFVNIQQQLRLYNARTITEVELYRISKRTLVNLVSSSISSTVQHNKNNNQQQNNETGNGNQNGQKSQPQKNFIKMNTSQRKIRNLNLGLFDKNKLKEQKIHLNLNLDELRIKSNSRQKNIFIKTNYKQIFQENIYESQNKLNVIFMNPVEQIFHRSASNDFGLSKNKFFKNNTLQNLKKEAIKTNRQKQRLIIESLQKRRSNEMLFRLKQVYFNKQEERYNQLIKIKRLFKINKKKSHSQLEKEKQKFTPSPSKKNFHHLIRFSN